MVNHYLVYGGELVKSFDLNRHVSDLFVLDRLNIVWVEVVRSDIRIDRWSHKSIFGTFVEDLGLSDNLRHL